MIQLILQESRMSLKLLSLIEIKQSITMHQAILAMETAFIQLAKGEAQLPLRTAVPIDTEEALTLTMPAYLAKDKTLGLKVVSIFPHNLNQGKPSITGLILLLDASTGEPQALMDAGYLTALRTGAISGLATKYFARDDASHVAIMGSGVQAYTQLEAVAAVRPITHVSVWSRHIEHTKDFVKKLEDQYEVKVHASAASAVINADVICTATGSQEPFIHLKDLAPHVHINAIGSHSRLMREISNETLKHAMVIVDQLEAALAESGEIISAVEENMLKKESIIEIGQWLLSKEGGYKERLTVFKSVGLAIQDLSVANIVYKNAMKRKLGQSFEF
jgi:ornithine cyclodeaminase